MHSPGVSHAFRPTEVVPFGSWCGEADWAQAVSGAGSISTPAQPTSARFADNVDLGFVGGRRLNDGDQSSPSARLRAVASGIRSEVTSGVFHPVFPRTAVSVRGRSRRLHRARKGLNEFIALRGPWTWGTMDATGIELEARSVFRRMAHSSLSKCLDRRCG